MRRGAIALLLTACSAFGDGTPAPTITPSPDASSNAGPDAASSSSSSSSGGMEAGTMVDSGSDAGTVALTWTGDDLASWSISNVDGTQTTDCCGDLCLSGGDCGNEAAAQCNDTIVLNGPAAGIATFTSTNPNAPKGQHRRDGFHARRSFGPITPGKYYRAEIDITRLSAMGNGVFVSVLGEQQPQWTLSVRDAKDQPLISIGGFWSTARCSQCDDNLEHIVSTKPFTTTSDALKLRLTATHESKDCGGDVGSVIVDVRYIRIIEL